ARLLAAFEEPPQRIEHLGARTHRILVAADADHAFFDSLEVRLERRPHTVFAATAPDAAGERRAGADARGLDELTSCECHDSSYCPFPDDVDVAGLSTPRNTSVAFCISSIVPSEMRAHCFSSGGKSRPTRTPSAAQPPRKSPAVIVLPMSTKMKFVCESVAV